MNVWVHTTISAFTITFGELLLKQHCHFFLYADSSKFCTAARTAEAYQTLPAL